MYIIRAVYYMWCELNVFSWTTPSAAIEWKKQKKKKNKNEMKIYVY